MTQVDIDAALKLAAEARRWSDKLHPWTDLPALCATVEALAARCRELEIDILEMTTARDLCKTAWTRSDEALRAAEAECDRMKATVSCWEQRAKIDEAAFVKAEAMVKDLTEKAKWFEAGNDLNLQRAESAEAERDRLNAEMKALMAGDALSHYYPELRARTEQAEARVKELEDDITACKITLTSGGGRLSSGAKLWQQQKARAEAAEAERDKMRECLSVALVDAAMSEEQWEKAEARLAVGVELLEVAQRKMAFLVRDYPDDKESHAWIDKARAALAKIWEGT